MSGRTIEDIQEEANAITDQSLDSTRRMVQYVEESRQVGQKTLENLDEQGDALRRVDQGLDKINADVRQAERHLTNMEKCCGCCLCPWKRRTNFEKNDEYTKAFGSSDDKAKGQGGNVTVGATSGQGQSARGAGGRGAGGRQDLVKRITGDEREDEMNDNLNIVVDVLGDLKAQASAMSGELEEQNEILDKLKGKVDSNASRVKGANERTAVLLRTA